MSGTFTIGALAQAAGVNLETIRFYQRRGFSLAGVRVGAIDEYRRTLKPEIPTLGNDEIPIRDEFEFEMLMA